jgi:hypothetical protein
MKGYEKESGRVKNEVTFEEADEKILLYIYIIFFFFFVIIFFYNFFFEREELRNHFQVSFAFSR